MQFKLCVPSLIIILQVYSLSFLDMSSAFDKVVYDMLFKKLIRPKPYTLAWPYTNCH